MFKGYFTAASGMIAQQRRMDTMTNNLANMNTPGYKADQSAIRSFPEMFVQQLNKASTLTSLNQSTTPVGSLSTGVYVQDLAPNFTQGDMHQTELRTDLALQNINLPDHANIFSLLNVQTAGCNIQGTATSPWIVSVI